MHVDVINNMKESVVNDFYIYLLKLINSDYTAKDCHIITKIMFINSMAGLDKIDHIYLKLV